jgi:dienelactone hydrolase
MHPRVRATALFALLAAALLVLAAPAAAKDKRYKDEIFEKVKVKTDRVYGNAEVGDYGERQDLLLDLYRPKGDKLKKRPVVIFAHGGSFSGGDKSEGPSPFLAREFAKRGYVAASINYRILVSQPCRTDSTGTIPPECYAAAIEDVNDGQAAVRYFRANAKKLKIDPSRIAFGGESAGGIIATGVGVFDEDVGDSGNPGFDSSIGAFISISGGVPDGVFVDANSAPGILFASLRDPIVPYDWSPETANALAAQGIASQLISYDSDVHVPFEDFGKQMEKLSSKFVYKQLDVKHAKGADQTG